MIELLTGKATQLDTPQGPKNQGSLRSAANIQCEAFCV
jgi:hypothetical protein